MLKLQRETFTPPDLVTWVVFHVMGAKIQFIVQTMACRPTINRVIFRNLFHKICNKVYLVENIIFVK